MFNVKPGALVGSDGLEPFALHHAINIQHLVSGQRKNFEAAGHVAVNKKTVTFTAE